MTNHTKTDAQGGGLIVEPPDTWKLRNGSRPSVNYDAPDRKSRYALVVKSSEDRMAEAVDEITASLIEKAKNGHLGSQREILNRILGVPVQPMDIQTTHAKIDITDERREHILRIERQIIEQTHGRRTIDGISHPVGETEEPTPSSSDEGTNPV